MERDHQGNTQIREKLLARGKYTEVFLISSPFFDNTFRVLKIAQTKALQATRALDNEYEKLAYLAKSGLVPNVYNYHQDLDGMPAIEMEYLGEQTLRKLINSLEEGRKEYSINYFIELVADLLKTIQLLHDRFEMAHLDLSPDNIIVKNKGDLSLIDFSQAAFQDEFKERQRAVGKKAYMAPEIFDGEYSFACDLFALGKIIDEMASLLKEHYRDDGRLAVLDELALELSGEDPLQRNRRTLAQSIETIELYLVSPLKSQQASLNMGLGHFI